MCVTQGNIFEMAIRGDLFSIVLISTIFCVSAQPAYSAYHHLQYGSCLFFDEEEVLRHGPPKLTDINNICLFLCKSTIFVDSNKDFSYLLGHVA